MRVGAYSLPWHMHIISILLEACRGISAETCMLDNVLSPDDFSSVSETQCKFEYIFPIMDSP